METKQAQASQVSSFSRWYVKNASLRPILYSRKEISSRGKQRSNARKVKSSCNWLENCVKLESYLPALTRMHKMMKFATRNKARQFAAKVGKTVLDLKTENGSRWAVKVVG